MGQDEQPVDPGKIDSTLDMSGSALPRIELDPVDAERQRKRILHSLFALGEQQQLGKYRLQRELARGAMGVIWAAEDPLLERPVAIKLIKTNAKLSEGFRERFRREAQAVARLQHPNVVEIHDYGLTDDAQPYMVMELLEGETLAAFIERARVLSPAALRPLLIQIAKALDAAHGLGIVHRDLKPANVFLTRRGDETLVKVLDFGLAVTRDRGLSEAEGLIAGTPYYMSPEQIRGDGVDHRTDLWALAVITYQALTGRLPFRALEFEGLRDEIVHGALPPATSIVPALGRDIDAFFERALAKDRERRFASGQELLTELAAALRTRAPRPTKILVVDDEPDVALMIEQWFEDQIESKRYEFLFAGDGQDALDKLREHVDVDIALTDLRMPGMDGLTLLAKIGAVAPALRAIVVSAYSDMSNIRRAMNHGAFDFLTKPLELDNLEATMDKAAQEVRRLRGALQSMEENAALRMFVNPAVLDRLLPILELSGEMRGEARAMTVVVARAFTEPGLGPRETVAQLNHTWDALVSAFDAAGGIAAHVRGDLLVVVFEGQGHEARALSACVAVDARRSSAPLAWSLGVASGLVTAASVGVPSRNRFDYAMFGPPVDLAHAIAQVAAPGQLLMSEALATSGGVGFSHGALGTSLRFGARTLALHRIGATGVAARERSKHRAATLATRELGDTATVDGALADETLPLTLGLPGDTAE